MRTKIKCKRALDAYRDLLLDGCLKIPCEKCKHFIVINDHYCTCKRENLIEILLPEYKNDIDKIDKEYSGR